MGGVGVHPAAAAGFERGADDYERGRPAFAAEAVQAIREHLGDRVVVDLAAGTGKLTRDLSGEIIVAVEPVAAMTRVAGPLMLRYKSGDGIWEAALAADDRFTPVTKHEFPNPVTLDRTTFAARIASTSYVSILPDDEREAVIDEALALLPPDEPFIESYITEVHLCRTTS